jgi:tripartite-type tricarboxylate transporter receptor subunit TctC
MKRRELLVAGAAGAAALATPALVSAQGAAWPTRGPIRLVAQFPPGGLVDTVSRLIAPHLSQALGQTVVVENRAGAGGLIGTDWVSKQPADGYTLLVSHASVHIYATATRKTMPFDPVNDFTHIGMLVEAPMVLLVRGQSTIQNLDQYLYAARNRPVRYGTSGIGSANHLFGEMLKIEGRAPQHDHIPYQGSAPAMQDLLGGSIDSLFDPITTNVGQLRAGSLRALAVSTPARLPGLPNIPTFAEQGYPKLTGSQWLGMSGPKNLPAPVVERLTTLVPEILAKPDVLSRLEDLQTLPRRKAVMGNDFVALVNSQIKTWTDVARQAKVEVIT